MINDYPRVVKFNDATLFELETKKAQLIEQGRALSKQIEDIELEMGKIDVRLQTQEAEVDIKDLKDKGNKIGVEMDNALNYFKKEMKEIQEQIFKRMAEKTDPRLRNDHKKLEQQKLELEKKRNKMALKAQSVKDRILSLVPRVAKQYLTDEFDDYYDLKLENGEMILRIFNHLEDFKTNFRKKLLKK